MGIFFWLRKKTLPPIPSDQLSSASIRFIFEEELPQAKEVIFHIESPQLAEPGSGRETMEILSGFGNDPKLALVCGEGKGHAFLRTAFLRELLPEYNAGAIRNFDELVGACLRKGGRVKTAPWFQLGK